MGIQIPEPMIFELSPKKIIKGKKKEAKKNKPKEKKAKDKEKKSKKDKKSKKLSVDKIDSVRNSEKQALKEAKLARKEIIAQQQAAEAARAREEAAKKARRQAELDVIQLVARRDLLKAQLDSLNPAKAKHAAAIVDINIELKEIDEALDSIRTRYGIATDSIDHGSKFKRAITTVKNGAKKFFGKVKKFFKKNKDTIIGVASIVVPVIGSIIASVIVAKR